ncbi:MULTISPECIES: Zn-ribbon domain-containing OB-fold protein [unclassified Cupriavidus]|uniref:Zn-ribbon domain-containing OB-fold protein n=1 Tax=unclassified Cupriavidus TaxID=2640874 RepID=UPI0010F47F5B|nr:MULTISPECIES: OB-fold domain-containing protein [unclassified Cupriavidus]MWL89493.1 DNA-binding protein [Cupriavidus sp. SW-Y-13]
MTTPYVSTPYKAPDELPDNTAFWQAAREGKLLVRHCTGCGKPHWYPRTLCPFCMGDTEWKTASGLGEIYSFSITRRAGPNPFCIAYVRLDEGVTMMTHIVDTDLDSVRIGQRVKVRFAETDGEGSAPVPVFAPVA